MLLYLIERDEVSIILYWKYVNNLHWNCVNIGIFNFRSLINDNVKKPSSGSSFQAENLSGLLVKNTKLRRGESLQFCKLSSDKESSALVTCCINILLSPSKVRDGSKASRRSFNRELFKNLKNILFCYKSQKIEYPLRFPN